MDQTSVTEPGASERETDASESEADVSEPSATRPAPAVAQEPANDAGSGRASSATFESLAVAGLVFGLFAIAIAVFAVGLAARAVSESSGSGDGGGGGSAPATLDISLTEFALDPGDTEIGAGGTITLDNDGTVQHDLVIEDTGSPLIDPGDSDELSVEGLDPGDYVMYCSIPGHREAGMEGQISVK